MKASVTATCTMAMIELTTQTERPYVRTAAKPVRKVEVKTACDEKALVLVPTTPNVAAESDASKV